MTYRVLVFQLGRTVEPHPFSWQVAPACYAHGLLSREADETVIVPSLGGVAAPARARRGGCGAGARRAWAGRAGRPRIPVPRVHAATVPDLRRRAAQEEAIGCV